MKITKFFILLVSLMVITISCSEENELPTPFDHKAQAIKDDAILKTFLETHIILLQLLLNILDL